MLLPCTLAEWAGAHAGRSIVAMTPHGNVHLRCLDAFPVLQKLLVIAIRIGHLDTYVLATC